MGLFKSKEEKEAIAKAKAEAKAKADAERIKLEGERLKKQAEERKLREERERIQRAKDDAIKHNDKLTKGGINASDVDPKHYQAVLVEQNNVIMMYLENIAIMNSNLLNNPILVSSRDARNKALAQYHKDYINPNTIK